MSLNLIIIVKLYGVVELLPIYNSNIEYKPQEKPKKQSQKRGKAVNRYVLIGACTVT